MDEKRKRATFIGYRMQDETLYVKICTKGGIGFAKLAPFIRSPTDMSRAKRISYAIVEPAGLRVSHSPLSTKAMSLQTCRGHRPTLAPPMG